MNPPTPVSPSPLFLHLALVTFALIPFFCVPRGDEDGVRRIMASRLRFNMQPLTSQRDYVNSYYYVKVATDMVSARGIWREISAFDVAEV